MYMNIVGTRYLHACYPKHTNTLEYRQEISSETTYSIGEKPTKQIFNFYLNLCNNNNKYVTIYRVSLFTFRSYGIYLTFQ